MNKIRIRVAAAAAVVVMTASATSGRLQADPPPIDDPVIPEMDSRDQGEGGYDFSSNCKKTFSSGSGINRFSWCFSDDGNVVQIEHSFGLEHVRVGGYYEGYCISSDSVKRGVSGGDLGNTGLNPPTYPSPIKVRHTTTDGVFRIEQTFAQTVDTKLITITMKVTNISNVVRNNVYLTRFIDADMSNTTGGDIWSSAARSVEATEPGSARLELIPTSTNFVTNAMIYASALPGLDHHCYDASADSTTSAPADDRSMGVLYQLLTLNPGQSKTVKFVYQVTI